MLINNRIKTVAVLYAVVGLLLALSDAFFPKLGLFRWWLNSWILQILIFVVLWIIAPFIFKCFSK